MRVAFKEWAIVVDALGAGEQIIVLRKGGIHEARTGFTVEHQNFLLFPTLFHQQRASVIPRAQTRYDQILPNLNANHARLEFCAEVIEWHLLDSPENAERLQGQHIWQNEVIRKRFDWGSSKSIYALAVRVSRLRSPVAVPMVPIYGGCKSWIELAEGVNTADSTPVLSHQAFTEKLQCFRNGLCLTS